MSGWNAAKVPTPHPPDIHCGLHETNALSQEVLILCLCLSVDLVSSGEQQDSRGGRSAPRQPQRLKPSSPNVGRHTVRCPL